MKQAVFLDRDGVINKAVIRAGHLSPPASVDEVEFVDGVSEGMEALRKAGFRLIVVTNQPDVGKGTQRRDVVEAIHERLRRVFPIDDIKVCYHVDQDGCLCRKPKPGMLLEAAHQWALDLRHSVMIGDRWRDIGAGKAAGCRTIRVNGEQTEPIPFEADAIVGSLLEASRLIVSQWRVDHAGWEGP